MDNNITSLQNYISGIKILTALEKNIWEQSIGHLVWKTPLQDHGYSAEARQEDKHEYEYDFIDWDDTLVEKQWKNLYSYFARFNKELLADRRDIRYYSGLEIKFRVGNSNGNSIDNGNGQSEEGKMEEEREWKTFPLKPLPIEVLIPFQLFAVATSSYEYD